MSKPIITTDNDRDNGAESGEWTAHLVAANDEALSDAEDTLEEWISDADFPEEWEDGRPSLTVFGNDSLARTKADWVKGMRKALKAA